MKKITLKCLCFALAALLVTPTLAACRQGEDPVDTTASDTSDVATPENTTAPTEEETDPPVTEPPSVSLDQLTFIPASVDGQVLTEKGHSPQILIRNYNETATDALGRVLPTSSEAGLPKEASAQL